MARKDLLANLLSNETSEPLPRELDETVRPPEARQAPRKATGALGAVTRSIDALAAKADLAQAMERKLAEGEIIVDLDPDRIESSFVQDRVIAEDQDFLDLVEAIRNRGQDSPILVRPHPENPGQYQIAFGHRRARAAKLLGRQVRAVVKLLDDREHVIAQGQENSARSDLSFIERTLFADRLERLGFDRETIMLALNADKTTISKMLSVSKRIPADILQWLDSARSIGRDRWHDISAKFEVSDFLDAARRLVSTPEFAALLPEKRFEMMETLRESKDHVHVSKKSTDVSQWKPASGAVRAFIKNTGKRYTIALDAQNASAFGAFLSKNLDRLYETFEQEQLKNGD
jgi:ParB family chromosome partitioning protein